MVAITVILAAVIGTFVLGLGQEVSQTAPQASLQMELNDDNSVDIEHNGGDTITADDIAMKKNGGTTDLWNTTGSTLSPGERMTIGAGASSGDTITLVHEPSGQVIAEADL